MGHFFWNKTSLTEIPFTALVQFFSVIGCITLYLFIFCIKEQQWLGKLTNEYYYALFFFLTASNIQWGNFPC